jgi:hypothetical protein
MLEEPRDTQTLQLPKLFRHSREAKAAFALRQTRRFGVIVERVVEVEEDGFDVRHFVARMLASGFSFGSSRSDQV